LHLNNTLQGTAIPAPVDAGLNPDDKSYI